MQRRISVLAVAAAATGLCLTGCSSSSKAANDTVTTPVGSADASTSTSTSTAPSAAAVSGTINVFAASSLTGTFTTLAKQFQALHPGTTVKLDFGASSALAIQINQGAPADVFASAAVKNMTQVITAGGASTATNFVKNVMEIAVPPGNPAKITGVADLAKPGIKVALCQAEVPCGATALSVFKNAGVTVKPVTLEADVKSTLTKVELKDVDAGVVYVTDVLAAGTKVVGVQIPAAVEASTEYPIATLTKASNTAGAAAFTAYVLSSDGAAVLTAAGFEKP